MTEHEEIVELFKTIADELILMNDAIELLNRKMDSLIGKKEKNGSEEKPSMYNLELISNNPEAHDYRIVEGRPGVPGGSR